MAALCGIYYGVRTPLKFDSTSPPPGFFPFKLSNGPPPGPPPGFDSLSPIFLHSLQSVMPVVLGVPHSLAPEEPNRGRTVYLLQCSSMVSTMGSDCRILISKGERISAPYDGLSNVAVPHNCISAGNPEEITQGPETYVSSIRTVALWVCMAVIFGVGVGFKDGVGKASEFFAGYLLEQSLSVDNLFVFVLIFKYFQVPTMYQGRVLSYGIAGAIIFRLSLILLGTATLQRFEAVNLLFAAILLFSSFKLFAADEDETDLSNNFVVKTCQKFIPVTGSKHNMLGGHIPSNYSGVWTQLGSSMHKKANYDGNLFVTIQDGVWKIRKSDYFNLEATPLLLTVVVIELSDIAFAVDSIPAVFGVTQDPFIVFTSNLFAILD
ncbi:Thylakoid membrane protein TERC, chloroplastic [Vitis vinifera]|uniref:Thylakoid membrane protein TERC, chloroplastic n=1 Tax=Vitis vinifera TaxID=29760 RepID=A0A438DWL8_VITVI|nr:Thylakoid membrane protein TERC, chloroplastic [Vitis vinifera]